MMRKVVLTALVAGSAAAHAVVGVAVGVFAAPEIAGPNEATQARVAIVNVRNISNSEGTSQSAPSFEPIAQQTSTTPPNSASDMPIADADIVSADPALRARYYESHEVDTPAAPQPDWEVDADQLIMSGVRKISFAIWVDERGVARRCKVLSMEPAGALKPEAIAARLCKTALTPAVRQGADVASVRHIELVLAP